MGALISRDHPRHPLPNELARLTLPLMLALLRDVGDIAAEAAFPELRGTERSKRGALIQAITAHRQMQ